jgi:predicted dehydrogenase
MIEKIRTAVVGAGKMGAIHAKVYSQLPQCQLIAVVDSDQAKAAQLAEKYNCPACADAAEILDRVDAVTIATPTTTHLQLAEPFLRHRIPVLIEKPLAPSVREGSRIVALAQRFDTVVAVGHSERCNPAVQALKRFRIEPKFIEAQRISPYPFRSTDVSVVLDVMIHDIDIVLALANSKIRRVEAVGVNVIGDMEDICNARLVFDNGCIANLTASRLALKSERRLRIFTPQAYFSVDYAKKSGVVLRADANQSVVEWIRAQQQRRDFNPAAVNWTEVVHLEPLAIDDKEPIRLEQESFLRAVQDRSCRPEVTGAEGLAALRCAEKILAAVQKHREG